VHVSKPPTGRSGVGATGGAGRLRLDDLDRPVGGNPPPAGVRHVLGRSRLGGLRLGLLAGLLGHRAGLRGLHRVGGREVQGAEYLLDDSGLGPVGTEDLRAGGRRAQRDRQLVLDRVLRDDAADRGQPLEVDAAGLPRLAPGPRSRGRGRAGDEAHRLGPADEPGRALHVRAGRAQVDRVHVVPHAGPRVLVQPVHRPARRDLELVALVDHGFHGARGRGGLLRGRLARGRLFLGRLCLAECLARYLVRTAGRGEGRRGYCSPEHKPTHDCGYDRAAHLPPCFA
jgi:hypothetical protein